MTPVANLQQVSTTSALPVEKFASGVIDTGDKFATGVVDTGSKFAASAVDTGGKVCWEFFCLINPTLSIRGQ